jgi:MarR family transcriptional regulator for hemolysin
MSTTNEIDQTKPGFDTEAREKRENSLVRVLGRMSRAMSLRLDSTIGDVPGGISAWWVMRHLHLDGPSIQTDIATGIGVVGSTLTRRLDQMENDGLVTRIPDPSDKRRVIVALSEKGKTLYTVQRDRTDAVSASFVSGVSAKDFEALDRVIDIINANLRAMGADPHARGGGRGRVQRWRDGK